MALDLKAELEAVLDGRCGADGPSQSCRVRDVRSAPVVDMSPAAIERRLAEVGALYPLMLSLRAAAVESTSDAVQGVARPSAPTG